MREFVTKLLCLAIALTVFRFLTSVNSHPNQPMGMSRATPRISQPSGMTYEEAQRRGQQLRAPLYREQQEQQRAQDAQTRQDQADIRQYMKQRGR